MATPVGSNIPGQNSGKKSGVIELSNRCLETQAQVNTVLGVIGVAASWTAHANAQRPLEADDEDGVRPALTEGQVAMDNLLITACDRMEKILKEESRWDDTFAQRVEKEYHEVHALQMATLGKQHEAASEITTPHFRYRPMLVRMLDGGWMSLLGDVDHLEYAVYGTGRSPQESVEAFDKAFVTGAGLSKTLLEHARDREHALENGQEVPPYPTQQIKKELNQNGKESLDTSAGQAGGGTQAPGENLG